MSTVREGSDLGDAIDVVRVGGNIGAEIRGVDLREPLGEAQFRAIHDAFVRHEVIVFRDQDITLEQQMAFARSASRHGRSVSPSSTKWSAGTRWAELVKLSGAKEG